MDCSVCRVRSSVSYCADCETLLCEECSESCDECQKRICSRHVHESRSGRPLCGACYEAYSQRRLAGDRDVGVDVEPPADTLRDAARLLRGEVSDIRPWKVSLGFGVAALAIAGALLALPALKDTVLGNVGIFTAAFIVAVCPLLALGWAVMGLVERHPSESRKFNLLGLVLALGALGLAFPILRSVPDSEEAVAIRQEIPASSLPEVDRDELTPEEREAWRQERLALYRLRP